MILDRLECSAASFEAQTGWHLAPEGACRGELCVPLPDDAVVGGLVDVSAVAERLAMPLVQDETAGLWALGPAVLGGRALDTAAAPDIELPDLEGRPFRLSSLCGQKILVYAWAPY
jgi:hypothetical protein